MVDFTRLKEINEKRTSQDKSQSEFAALLRSESATRSTILDAFSSLVRYLEGHTSKTELVNQLEEIGTPDVLKVVVAINSLHETLKTHENTDLTEVTQLMRRLVDEAEKIPKQLPEQKEFTQIDYSEQLASITKAVTAVETVVKEQKLIAEAPIVNVPEAVINVDAPNLSPLQEGLRDVVEAVKAIIIPEFRSDNKELEKLVRSSNKLLKDILDKPVGGGGGGGRVSPYENAAGIPEFVKLNGGRIPVNSEDPITFYAAARGGRLSFNITTGVVTITGSAEQPLALLENPTGSNKDVYLDLGEFGSSVNTQFRRYSAPTINTRGIAMLPRNMSGGATASVLRFYPAGQFTLSNSGTVSKTAHIAAYNQYKTDIKGRVILRPGSTVYWTIDQPSGGSNFTASIYFEYYELAAEA